MARTYDLGCDDCNVCLWIGQSGPSGRRWLYNAPAAVRALEVFMFAHIGHRLRFEDSERRPDEWRAVEAADLTDAPDPS